jgi:histidinol-phosphate aminotransferase
MRSASSVRAVDIEESSARDTMAASSPVSLTTATVKSPSELKTCASTIAEVIPRVRDDLQTLPGYHSPQLDVDVRLNTNEAPGPPPAGFGPELARRMSEVSWNRYPDRHASSLREAIAQLEGVGADNVFVANGSNEVLQTLCLTYGGHGRSVLTFEPTYAMHSQIARTVQCTSVAADRNSSFEVDPDTMAAAIEDSDPSIVFLCSPNNPTGTAEKLSTVTSALNQVGGLLVVDEAYGQFASFSAKKLLSEDVPLVVTRTFSKTWSMAGARLGYLLGPREVVAELEKVVLPYHLDVAKQLAGEVALLFVEEMEDRVAGIVAERERLIVSMRSLGLEVFDSQANFVLFRTTRSGLSGDAVWQGLVDASVLVRNCSSWARLGDCLRVTVGMPGENDHFLTSLAGVLTARIPS